MSKYYCSEMCCRVANDTIQVLGGSGYMKDYAAERHLRDARLDHQRTHHDRAKLLWSHLGKECGPGG